MGIQGTGRVGMAHVTSISVYLRTKKQIVAGKKITGDASYTVLLERVMRYMTDNNLWDQLPPPYDSYG